MTLTAGSPTTAEPREPTSVHRRRGLIGTVAALIVVGAAGTGLGLALTHSTSSANRATGMLGYYHSMMGRYSSSSMMGGSSGYGWMKGASGYRWMMGGAHAPGWMHGGSLPGFMMGGNTDPGQVMGRLFADAPGPRLSAATATKLGSAAPAGATVSRTDNRIVFTTRIVEFTALASPPGGPDETFRIAGLVNPTISVPLGARVTIHVINADPDTSHGLVITVPPAAAAYMPMMGAPPSFTGAAIWFLGDPTAAGLHEATTSFTASRIGAYVYLCAVPGHSQKGMLGTFDVKP